MQSIIFEQSFSDSKLEYKPWRSLVLIAFLISITRVNLLPDINFPAWLAADGLAFLIALKRQEEFIKTLDRNKLLLSVPLLSLLSSLWSLTPISTAYHAVQFVFVILVAIALFPKFGLFDLLKCIFLYNFIIQFGSLYVYFSGGYWPEGFPGAYLHKNLLGMFSTLQIITAFVLFVNGWNRILCLLSIVLAVLLLILSASGTSLVLSVAIWALFPFARTIQKGMTKTFMTIGSLGILFSLVGFYLVSGVRIEIVDGILNLLGKDSSLTGRSVLWDYAMLAIPKNQWFGIGFLAYWDSPFTTAAGLQNEMQQDLRMFHNVYIEVAVALGFIGAMLFTLTLVQQILRSILYFIERDDYLSAYPFVFLVWIAALSMTENPIYGVLPMQFILATVVISSFASR